MIPIRFVRRVLLNTTKNFIQFRSPEYVVPCVTVSLTNNYGQRYQSSVAVDDSYLKKFMRAVGWMDKFRTVLLNTTKNFIQFRSPEYVVPCVTVSLTNNYGQRYQSSVAVDDSYLKKFMRAVGWMDKFRTVLLNTTKNFIQFRSPEYVVPCVTVSLTNNYGQRYQSSVAVDDSYLKKFMRAVGWMDKFRTVLLNTTKNFIQFRSPEYVVPCVTVSLTNNYGQRYQSSVAVDDSYLKKFMRAVGWMDKFRTVLLNTTKNFIQFRSPEYVVPCVTVSLTNNYGQRYQSSVAVDDSYLKKFMRAVGWMDKFRTRLKLTGYFLYETVPDSVNYVEWFKVCNLPDTFTSWFYVTELHVWILMVRCMAEDITPGTKTTYVKEDGHFIRNCILEALWADVANRIKLLDGSNLVLSRKQVWELSEQFQAALVSYDEGLHDDKILASAIWRRVYEFNPDMNPLLIERIVHFVRHQIAELDRIPTKDFKGTPQITWLSIKKH